MKGAMNHPLKFLFILCIVTLLVSCVGESRNSDLDGSEMVRIKLASTTSTDNSGLFQVLLPTFTAKSGIKVDVIAVGTGTAIELGRKGDVDIILVHARTLEDQFIAEGFGVNRRDVMYNDFVILGPESDPAGVKGMSSAAEALKQIAQEQVPFISRGDNSGTHVKELSLWELNHTEPQGDWYREAGQGMGAVITMTDSLSGYTLSDRATYVAMRDKIDLGIIVEGDEILFNPYGVIPVNPSVHPGVKYHEAMQLVAFLTSLEGQQVIKDFAIDGLSLFYPSAVDSILLK